MRIVAILSVAFVVLVGVVAVTYPNESDEVRQRNAAFMKLGDGDTPGGLKADPEQGDAGSNVIDRKTGDLLGVKGIEDWMGGGLLAMSAEDLDAVCQGLNQMSRIVEKLDAKNPVAADLRAALERTKNSLKDVQVTSFDFHDDNDDGYVDKASPNVNGFQESSDGADDDDLCW